jgi:hypothetical protein
MAAEPHVPAVFERGELIAARDRIEAPLAHFGRRDDEAVVAGVAALHYDGDARPLLRRDVLEALTDALVEVDAVDPVTCLA